MNVQFLPQQSSYSADYKCKCYQKPIYGNGLDRVSFKAGKEKQIGKTQKFVNKLFNRKLCECDFGKLDGIQNGLKSFEGLSLKQVAMALTDLHSMNMISGCTRHCLHCYANAQPFVKRAPYEDLKQICDDIKELQNRTGLKVCHHHGQAYINVGFDADALDCHLFDKNGKKHDFVDLAKLVYESTGYKPVFDTNGWDTKEKQEIAEFYIKKLLEDDNYENFYQINISVNPFNPRYVKALKSGYDANILYRPYTKVVFATDDNKEDNTPQELIKAQELYTKYVQNVANTLLTFKPLIKTGKLGLIVRALDNNIDNMQGFRVEDFATTLKHITSELYFRYQFRGDLTKEEFDFYVDNLSRVSTRLFSSGRMEKFYKVTNNRSLSGIEKIDSERTESEARIEAIKKEKKLSAAKLRYLKMISPDGRVFLYDNYAIIPTDVQLKTSQSKIEKPFQIGVENFVVTEDIVDIF